MLDDFMSVLQDFTPADIVIQGGRMNMDQNLAYVSCCGFDAHTRAGMDLRGFHFFTALRLRDPFI